MLCQGLAFLYKQETKQTMRRLQLTLWFVLFTVISHSQWLGDDYYVLTFEDTATLPHLRMDSISNRNGLWQVGSPQKAVFTSAQSPPRAIVTDTVQPYPVNDTSSFTVVNIASGYGWLYPHTVMLSGYYQVHSDTLTDFGTIELSPDNGTTWIDLINDTLYSAYYQWWSTVPVLSGNSNGWKYFSTWLSPLGPLFNVQLNDTILFRFTFISDSIQTNKDGLIFDDLVFEDWIEGVPFIRDDDRVSIYPNPTNEWLSLRCERGTGARSVQVFNFNSELVYESRNFSEEGLETRHLPDGVYWLKYSDNRIFAVKRFLVQH